MTWAWVHEAILHPIIIIIYIRYIIIYIKDYNLRRQALLFCKINFIVIYIKYTYIIYEVIILKEGMFRVNLLLDPENDKEIIEQLKAVQNKQGYIKRLIMKDAGIEPHAPKNKPGKTAKDLTGMKFGKWTVIKRAKELDKPGRTVWICRCECGNEKPVIAQALKNGTSKQCGSCRSKNIVNKSADPRRRINGKPTKLYRTWEGIINRCCHPSNKSYKDYGGRGINICDEWRHDYIAFYEYVTQLDRYGEEGMTIDRIDNDKGYEPGNVRWATRKEQRHNQRRMK